MTKTNFDQLSLLPEVLTAVTEMGFVEATGVQAESIPIIRTGVDVLARSQTGTGKTVAFGIPAVECVDQTVTQPQVLILSPTRELAQQCGDEIRKLSKYLPRVKTADIFGGGDYRSQFRELQRAQLVIGTPGRIMDHINRGTLHLENLKMVVLDEADEMLNMGFREDIEFILKDVPEERQIVLFSATVPAGILKITQQFQNNPVRIDINREQVTLGNIKQIFAQVPMGYKQNALNLMLHYYKPVRAIVFSNTKAMVDELTESLNSNGFVAEGLHGDMKQPQRTSVMNGFKKGRVNILVATDVAARGIDVSDVDYVFNYDIPKESDYYVHRIGRTGRAGRTGTAVTLISGRQQLVQLKRLGQVTKSEMTQVAVPTVEMVEQENRNRTFATLEVALEQEPSTADVALIQRLLDGGHSAEKIAALLLPLAFGKEDVELKDVPGGGKITTLKHREEAPRRGAGLVKGSGGNRPGDETMRRFVLDIGSGSRVTINHIVGAITERTGISSADLGKIQMGEDYTIVAVQGHKLEQVLSNMGGCKICRKPVHVSALHESAGGGKRDHHRSGGAGFNRGSKSRHGNSYTKGGKPPVKRKSK